MSRPAPLSKRRQWLIRALFIIITSLIIYDRLAALIFYYRSPLARGLSAEFGGFDKTFEYRVAIAFPIGTPDVKVREELAAQGFTRDHRLERGDEEVWTIMHGPGIEIVCSRDWSVMWKSNDLHEIVSIKGSYVGACL